MYFDGLLWKRLMLVGEKCTPRHGLVWFWFKSGRVLSLRKTLYSNICVKVEVNPYKINFLPIFTAFMLVNGRFDVHLCFMEDARNINIDSRSVLWVLSEATTTLQSLKYSQKTPETWVKTDKMEQIIWARQNIMLLHNFILESAA